ncbi:MAG: TetR/AcrR family transcriptional regulator [Elusimicrobiota bacterium]|jgi:AcrR family transcriptional regulator|nr:TetR/AcrR family transcriptional regulator [Elusimicrobiota bacterium]
MTKLNQSIHEQLIELGKQALYKKDGGFVSIRDICIKGGINLGLFSYYFKNKNNFIQVVLKSILDDIEKEREVFLEKYSSLVSIERFKKVILALIRQMKEQSNVYENVLKNIDLCDESFTTYAQDFQNRWIAFFLQLIEECKDDGYFLPELDSNQILAIVFGSVVSYSKSIKDLEPEVFYIKINEMLEFVIGRVAGGGGEKKF